MDYVEMQAFLDTKLDAAVNSAEEPVAAYLVEVHFTLKKLMADVQGLLDDQSAWPAYGNGVD